MANESQQEGMAELRLCPATGRWTLVPDPSRRKQRGKPENFLKRARKAVRQRTGECPFCPGWDGRPGRRPNEPIANDWSGYNWNMTRAANWDGDWEVFLIKNKDPLYTWADPDLQATIHGEVKFEVLDAIGFSEVIVECPGEDQQLMAAKGITEIPLRVHRPLGMERARVGGAMRCQLVLDAIRKRYRDLQEDSRIRHVCAFRNHRPEAGATQPHPHSQLVATPIVPEEVATELETARRHYEGLRGKCSFCEMIELEIGRHSRLKRQGEAHGSRVVYDTQDFLVIHPFASKCPFETWILPKKHRPSFTDIEYAQLGNLGFTLAHVLRRLYMCLFDPAYNLVFRSAPYPPIQLGTPREEGATGRAYPYYHWHIRIEPQGLSTPGGYEVSTAIFVDAAAPEDTAEFIRKRGVLFENDRDKWGTLDWYLQNPTKEESKMGIERDEKIAALANIVEILETERAKAGDEWLSLQDWEAQKLTEVKERLASVGRGDTGNGWAEPFRNRSEPRLSESA